MVADSSIAGPSPNVIDPYPSKPYTTNENTVKFTCLKAGLSSVTFHMEVDKVPYYDADYNKQYKNLAFDIVKGVTCNESVPAPSGITVNDTTPCQLTVSWAYDDNFLPTGFSIERVKTPATDWAEIATVDGDKRTYVNAKATDNTLELGATYCYRIRAYKDYSGIGRVYSAYSTDVGCGTKQ
ncbi:MAG: fibronectin type III domain-containing protein [bacterium]